MRGSCARYAHLAPAAIINRSTPHQARIPAAPAASANVLLHVIDHSPFPPYLSRHFASHRPLILLTTYFIALQALQAARAREAQELNSHFGPLQKAVK